jgi:hypothetical protein
LLSERRREERRSIRPLVKYEAVGEILGRWSLLGLQLKNLNEGFNTKKH